MKPGGRSLAFALAVLTFSGTALPAQTTDPAFSPAVRSDFVVVDQERLFADSEFGQRFRQERAAESKSLAEENRRIEAQLIEEEQLLTDRRPGLAASEFRDLADKFDARVTEIRLEQDRKARMLTQRETAERQAFLQAAIPVLGQVLSDFGAVAVFDRRSVLLSDDRIDITDVAIAQVNAVLGDGTQRLLDPGSQPQPAEDQN